MAARTKHKIVVHGGGLLAGFEIETEWKEPPRLMRCWRPVSPSVPYILVRDRYRSDRANPALGEWHYWIVPEHEAEEVNFDPTPLVRDGGGS